MALDSSVNPDSIFKDIPVITRNGGTQIVGSHELPKHITVHKFFTGSGVPIRFYTAKAQNETAMIMGASGFKTDFILTPDEILELNKQGVSVAWLAIPNPGRNSNFMRYIVEAAKETLVNPRYSTIQRWCRRKVPKIFFGHSTGAQLFLRMAADGHHEKLNDLFSGAVFSSPYIAPPGTENPYVPASLALDFYSWKHANRLPSETPLGQAYLNKSDRTDADMNSPDLAKYQVPTYSQIQELRKGGGLILNELRNPDSYIHRLNMPFLIAAGENDQFSSPKISAKIAKTLGGAFYYAQDQDHNPISNNKAGFRTTASAIRAMAEGNFSKFTIEHNLHDYTVNSEAFTVSKLAFAAANGTLKAAMQQLSLDRLRQSMPALFSRTQP